MNERGALIDRTMVHRGVSKILTALSAVLRGRKRPVDVSWRMDEICIKVAQQWHHWAVHRDRDATDFPLKFERDTSLASRFLKHAIRLHGQPEKITLDKVGANTTAKDDYAIARDSEIVFRRSQYRNEIIEQGHREISRASYIGAQVPMLRTSSPVYGRCADSQGATRVPRRVRIAPSLAFLLFSLTLLTGNQSRAVAAIRGLIVTRKMALST